MEVRQHLIYFCLYCVRTSFIDRTQHRAEIIQIFKNVGLKWYISYFSVN